TSTNPVRSRSQSLGVIGCRFVFGTGRVISPIQNPAYRRSRPTFCIPKATCCGPQLAVRHPSHLLCPGTGRPSAVSPHVGEDDGDKLLPGEASSAQSRDVDDARRWFETYDELCRLKQKILT